MPIKLPLNTMSSGEKVQLLEQDWDNLCYQSVMCARQNGLPRF